MKEENKEQEAADSVNGAPEINDMDNGSNPVSNEHSNGSSAGAEKSNETDSEKDFVDQQKENSEPVVSGEMQSTEEQFLEAVPESNEDHSSDNEEEHDPEIDFSSLNKEELVDILTKLVEENDVQSVKARFNAAKDLAASLFSQEQEDALNKFIEDGGIKDDFSPVPDPLFEQFNKAIKLFGRKRAEFAEQIEKQRSANLDAKSAILKELKELIQNEENMKKAFDAFHELQARWRATGPVPAGNVRDIQMTYKFLVDKFYDYIRINKELQDLDHRHNLDSKIQLCEQAEELLLEPSLNAALKKLHNLQDKWREVGPVPREQKDEIWDRFKGVCDKIFTKRKEYLAATAVKFEQNLVAKAKLCEVAEAVIPEENWKHKQWQEASKVLADLQTEWKKSGPVSKKAGDEIWARFRIPFDRFFKLKNEFYHQRKQEMAANLQQKTELCIQAEALQNSTDWKSTTAELIRLQQEWKKTGPVNERQSEKIWKRFRTACDLFFQNKSTHFSDVDKQQVENLEKKRKLIEEVEAFVPGGNNGADIEQLKAFQRAWSETGLVPIAQKDEIQKRYRAAIDAHFDKLKLPYEEKQRFRNSGKPEHHRSGDSGGKIDYERRSLLSKVAELKNDVQVWENNIGFFARSKNAEALKKEFEEKISVARKEIERLGALLKQ
ncbi:MAG TPA: DUF349 domain-containing protein [Bacteroidia bacterium]|nr:DUF349 domain-containing protein [Bacteroidia bacterium]